MNNILLIADDSEDLLELFIHAAKKHNFHVSTAASKKIFLSLLEQIKPDLILLDIILGGYNGMEICKEIKSKEEYKLIPVILMSGHPISLNECKNFNADDVIQKPFSMDGNFLKN